MVLKDVLGEEIRGAVSASRNGGRRKVPVRMVGDLLAVSIVSSPQLVMPAPFLDLFNESEALHGA